MNPTYGLPDYVRTLDLRQRLSHRYHAACGTFSTAGGGLRYCPHCGREGEMQTVELRRPGTIERLVVGRPARHWDGPQAFGTVRIPFGDTAASVATAFTDLDVGAAPFDTAAWRGQPVVPTMRLLAAEPDGVILYGVKYRPAPWPAGHGPRPATTTLQPAPRPGIAALGVAVPRDRMRTAELAEFLRLDPQYVSLGLGVSEVAVPAFDQDATTLAIDATLDALALLPPDFARTVGLVVVGSESKPYAVKPIATSVVHAAGLGDQVIAYDAEFACIGAGMQLAPALALIRSGAIESALVIGADVAQGAPGDPLDLDTGAGAVCVVLSRYNVVLEPVALCASTGDHPDFARRAGRPYPFHGGAFTGEPSYFAFQRRAIQNALGEAGVAPGDIVGASLHSPNMRFVRRLAADVGLTAPRGAGRPPCLIASAGEWLGNTYDAAALFGLAELLHEPERRLPGGDDPDWRVRLAPGNLLLVGFYGSGAAAAAAVFRVTEGIHAYRDAVVPLSVYRGGTADGPVRRRVSPLQRYAAKGMIRTPDDAP